MDRIHQKNHIAAGVRRARPKAQTVLDNPPASLAAALRMDLREGRKLVPGCQEQIAEWLGIEADSVYKLTSRLDQKITTEHIEAIVAATGGRHARAYLQGLAVHSPLGEEADDGDVQTALAGVLEHLAAVNAQVAEDLSLRDDTPQRLDRNELGALALQIEQLHADLGALAATIDALQERTER